MVAERDPHALGRGHLVAHEGEQRRHDQRGAGARVAQQAGGDEVDGGLAEPGALHDQGPAAVGDDRLDGGDLGGAQHGVGPGQRLRAAPGPARRRGGAHRADSTDDADPANSDPMPG